MPRHLLRFTGVAAVATVWSTLLLGAHRAHFDLFGPRPLSYLARHDASAALFAVGVGAAAVLFIAFHQYLRSQYPTSVGFSVAMLGGMVCQLLVAVFRIGGAGTTNGIHIVTSLALGLSLPLLMWRFAAAQHPGPWRRRCYALFFAEATACLVGYALSVRHIAPLAEVVAGVFFHVWILTTTVAGAAYRSSPRRQRAPRFAATPGVASAPLPPPIRNVAGML